MKQNQTLLEKAKAISVAPQGRRVSEELRKETMELVLAYFKGEITQSQAAKVIKPNGTGAVAAFHAAIAHAVRDAIHEGRIKIL